MSELEILVRKNDDSVIQTEWDNVIWSDVKEIGLKSSCGVVGFNKQYGCPIWYQLKQETYDKPIFYILQRFWGKIGDTWHQFYITEPGTTRTPYYTTRDNTDVVIDERTMGWSGTINYSGYDFPVKVGIKCIEGGLPDFLKTEVTTPIALANHGIEYQIYLNPDYAGDAQKNIKWVRVYTQYYENSKCGIYTDYDILTLMDVVNVPTLPYYFIEFHNEDKSKCLASFDFNDIFKNSSNRFIKIEQTDTPLGITYVLKVGCTFGSISSGETMTIDPTFGYDKWRTLAWDIRRQGLLSRTDEQIIKMKKNADMEILRIEEEQALHIKHPYIYMGQLASRIPDLTTEEIEAEYDEETQHFIESLDRKKYHRDLLNIKILGDY